MGVYSEYLNAGLNFEQLGDERKKQLGRVSQLRGGRDVLVMAAHFAKAGVAPVSIDVDDLLPLTDQLANLSGGALDVVLETPGGSGEVAEDVVRILHDKYAEVAFIVPGWAKSAGTIMAMAGHEILMGQASALGPIDAQLSWQGKSFSADALIEGLEKIKREVEESGQLNRAYVPILQGISPGEMQAAENALNFAKILVADWLATHKFRNWNFHSDGITPVTEIEKRSRAEDIAGVLCDHRRWLTHGRSLRAEDLEGMGLRITRYDQNQELNDAITRYYTLLQMTFQSNAYKIFETQTSQIYRFIAQQVPAPAEGSPPSADLAVIEAQCGKCASRVRIQANLGAPKPLQEGCLPFPSGNRLQCPSCGAEMDLTDARRQLEAQARRPIVIEGEA